MLEIRDLVKVYPSGTRAVDGVSLDIQRGEFVVLIGLSGSGKSSLLRCINRLVEPTSGRIVFDGADVTRASRAELRRIRRRIGMVFQQFNLVRRGSVLSNTLAGRLGSAPRGARSSAVRCARTSPRRSRTSDASGSPTKPSLARTRCPAASSSGWASRAR